MADELSGFTLHFDKTVEVQNENPELIRDSCFVKLDRPS